MAGRTAYSQDQRDRALGALMASAVEDPKTGEMKPQFKPVGRKLGKSETTLRRWWAERNQERDDALRRGVTRGTETVAEDGASDWLRASWLGVQAMCAHVLDPDHWTEKVHVNEKTGDATVVRHAPRLNEIAKSADIVAGLIKPVGEALGINAAQATGPTSEVDEIEARMRAAGLL